VQVAPAAHPHRHNERRQPDPTTVIARVRWNWNSDRADQYSPRRSRSDLPALPASAGDRKRMIRGFWGVRRLARVPGRGAGGGGRSLSCLGVGPLAFAAGLMMGSRTWPGSHAFPALYRAAAALLPTLADPGYEGAGLGIHIPVRQPAGGQDLDINTRTRNALQRSLRCLDERGLAAHHR
jgi:hypothetical protein